MLNLTPHAIVIRNENGVDTIYPPSGTVARVEMEERVIQLVDGIPVISRHATGVSGLPTEGQFIVSSMVLDALDDVYHMAAFAPDTGSTSIRNEKGNVVAVTRLVTK